MKEIKLEDFSIRLVSETSGMCAISFTKETRGGKRVDVLHVKKDVGEIIVGLLACEPRADESIRTDVFLALNQCLSIRVGGDMIGIYHYSDGTMTNMREIRGEELARIRRDQCECTEKSK